MITDALIGAFISAFEAILGLMPKWEPDLAELETDAAQLGSAAGMVDGYLPLGMIFISLGILITARIALMVVQLVQWVWDRLPLT